MLNVAVVVVVVVAIVFVIVLSLLLYTRGRKIRTSFTTDEIRFRVHDLPPSSSPTNNNNNNNQPNTQHRHPLSSSLEDYARTRIVQGDGVGAFEYLRQSVTSEKSPTAVLMIAELYKNGLHGSVNPDKMEAARVYRVIIENRNKFPVHVVTSAEQNLDELTRLFTNGQARDTDVYIGAVGLPSDYHFELARTLVRFGTYHRNTEELPRGNGQQRQQQQRTHDELVGRMWNYAQYMMPTRVVDIDDDDEIAQEVIEELIAHRHGDNAAIDVARVQMAVHNNAQNVHSSTVINCADHILQECLAAEPMLTKRMAQTRVIDACARTDVSSEDVHKVLRAMNSEPHMRFKVSDTDVFRAVVSKIESDSIEQRRNDVMEILCRQLQSAVERGNVVCSTGRIVRMLSVFDGLEDSPLKQKIVPEWAMDQELANLAAKIREDVLAKSSETERTQYNDGTSDALVEQMTRQYEERAMSTYKNVVSPEALKKKIAVYTDAF
jgi:hypothetical protein